MFTAAVQHYRFDEGVVRYAAATGRTVGDVLRQQAKLLALDLAHLTPPFRDISGRNASFNEERAIGQLAVSRDLNKIFQTSDDSEFRRARLFSNPRNPKLAARLQQVIAAGDTVALNAIYKNARLASLQPLRPPFNAFHRSQRNARTGRIGRSVSQRLVRDTDLRKYLKEKLARVGLLKSGWLAGAVQFGARLPAWIARHRGEGSAVDQSESSVNPIVSMTNSVSYAASAKANTRFADLALRARANTIARALQAKMDGLWTRSKR